MKKADFDGVMESVHQAKSFLQSGKAGNVRIHIPDEINVAVIRNRTGLSQAAFARQIGVSVATLRNWEQARRSPDGPARVLLAMLRTDPQIVVKTLRKAA
jgi:putative transcriptional regulator